MDNKRKTYRYWNDINNIYFELESVIENIGTFPTVDQLKKLGLSSMVTSITKNHGGLLKFRKKYQYQPIQVKKGYYSSLENVISVIESCKDDIGHFPIISELDSYKPGIKAGIIKYHGSYNHFRSILGEDIIQKKVKYWEDIRNIKFHIEKLIKFLGYFPSYKEITELGEKGLYQGIAKYQGGITGLRESLGYSKSKSTLEYKYKVLLDTHVDEINYVDNRKKLLFEKYCIWQAKNV